MQGPRSKPIALILEDEPRFRDFLAEVLRDMECSPVAAANGPDAMRIVKATPPHLLLLDLNLPVMDGLTFLEQFRRLCPDAAVVIITGFGDLESARKAIRLGVTDFLLKPCDLGQIEQAIDGARRRVMSRGLPGSDRPAALLEPAARTEKEGRSLAELEREAILEALRQNGGNRSVTAQRLGISRRALYNKIAAYRDEGHGTP